MIHTAEKCITLILFLVEIPFCQSEEPTASANDQTVRQKNPRVLEPGSPIAKAYHKSEESIQASEDFIREYPRERDLCAGALLNIAKRYAKQGEKRKAIDVYQKAIDEYGNEVVPDVCATFLVKDWALFRIGRLERDIGNRDKALDIFGTLMKSSDFNTRTGSRIEYLATKQSHLKVTAKVAVHGMKSCSIGKRMPVSVTVENPTNETVIFMCHAHICLQHTSAIAPREGSEEISLAPGEKRTMNLTFTEKDTDHLSVGINQLTASLTGISYDTNSESIEIHK
jgi:hypothetical protein